MDVIVASRANVVNGESLEQNLTNDRDDFDTIPLLQRPDGWGELDEARTTETK